MYGNGITINIGNETGGIIVNSNADLLYTDLIDIRKKGIFTAISQSSYLYFFFLFLSIDMRFVVIFRFWVQIVSLRIVHFFIVFVFSLIHIFSHLIFAILLFWVVQHFLPSFLFFSIKQVHRISSGTIIDSILQWGVTFETGSNCYQSLLCEHTETSCNAKIVNSIIGILILQ